MNDQTANNEQATSQPASPNNNLSDSVVVGLLQMLPSSNDTEFNFNKAIDYCRWAAEGGADIALMPEMWSIGYTAFHGTDPKDVKTWQDQAISRDSEWLKRFEALAKELNIAIGVTYLEKIDNGAPRNSLTLIDRHGKQLYTYAKVHTCDFANFEAVTTPGEEWHVATLDTVKGPIEVGTMICFDREFPESARALMVKGAELILTPNACFLPPLRIDQFRVRALENSCAVAMTNYPEPYMNGHSVAFDAAAEPLVEADGKEGIYYAVLNLPGMRFYRERTIWGNAYRKPHRYDVLTEQNNIEIFDREDLYTGEKYDASKR